MVKSLSWFGKKRIYLDYTWHFLFVCLQSGNKREKMVKHRNSHLHHNSEQFPGKKVKFFLTIFDKFFKEAAQAIPDLD